jgi:hypothetical protein
MFHEKSRKNLALTDQTAVYGRQQFVFVSLLFQQRHRVCQIRRIPDCKTGGYPKLPKPVINLIYPFLNDNLNGYIFTEDFFLLTFQPNSSIIFTNQTSWGFQIRKVVRFGGRICSTAICRISN